MDREDDQSSAMSMVEPILAGLYNIVDEAVAFYFNDEHYSDAARAEHNDRAVANNIYSHAEKRLVTFAEQTSGLNVINLRSLIVANYRDKGLFRFKKVKANGKHSNYQTKQQQDYDDQKPFKDFPEPAVRLTVGYELGASGFGLKRIMIARPIGRTIFWTAQVVMDAEVARWEDITPLRFGATETTDFNADRARSNRGRG